MSSIRTGIVAALLLALPMAAALSVSAAAQDSGPATDASAETDDRDVYGPVENPEPAVSQCEPQASDDGLPDRDVIVVCRDLVDPDSVMSVIKKPPQEGAGDVPRAPAMAEPPCWVTKDKTLCIRFGHVPEYPPLIDMTAFPEPLSDAEAALVTSAPEAAVEGEVTPMPPVGKRVPIDLED